MEVCGVSDCPDGPLWSRRAGRDLVHSLTRSDIKLIARKGYTRFINKKREDATK